MSRAPTVKKMCASLGWAQNGAMCYHAPDSSPGTDLLPWPVTLTELEILSAFPLDRIPLILASDPNSVPASLGIPDVWGEEWFRDVIVPYLSKRLELEDL